jgi:hypothetical protein
MRGVADARVLRMQTSSSVAVLGADVSGSWKVVVTGQRTKNDAQQRSWHEY